MKKMKTFRNVLLMVCLLTAGANSAWAAEGTETERTDANAKLRSGSTYRIYTTYNETKYYLTSDGTLTSTEGSATAFTLNRQTHTSGSAYSDGWYIISGSNKFTNCNSSGGPSENETIHTTTSNSRVWEEQVFFLNSSGYYAIRSTNSSGSNYGYNCYWTIDTKSAAPSKAIYYTTAASADYIWSVELVTLGFDSGRTYYIQNANSGYSKTYFAKTSTDDTYLKLVSSTDDAAKVVIMQVSQSVSGAATNKYVLYDVVGKKFIVSKAKSSKWEVSADTPGTIYINNNTSGTESLSGLTSSTYYFTLGYATSSGYANTNNSGNAGEVVGWDESNNGSQWIITDTGEGYSDVIGIVPQAVYYLKHNNSARNRYISGTLGSDNIVLTTNTESEYANLSFLPVSGEEGYFYIYTQNGYFLTSNSTNSSSWTWSQTPQKVYVKANPTYYETSGWQSQKMTYLLSSASSGNHYANPQNNNSTEGVYTYDGDHPSDGGNNWFLTKVSDASATLPLNNLGDGNIETMVTAAYTNSTCLSYSATVTSAGYSTLVVPFTTSSLPSGVEAWSLESISDTKIQGTSLSAITAHQPVLLKGSAGTYTFTSSAVPAWSTSLTNGLLTGVYASTTATAGTYVLQNLDSTPAFYLVASDSEPTIGAFRAYLTASNNARALTFDFGGVTGVTDMKADTEEVRGDYYDLMGRRVTNPTKGIYIVNGKKIIK